jgi:erythromycin esterase-like protein
VEHDILDGEEYQIGPQNAHLVRDTERYYKAMYWSSARSWTLRNTHMFDILLHLLQYRPPPAHKAIVWAHNSHIGDTRYTFWVTRMLQS